MAMGKDQGMTVAVIIFVILTVISMGAAVLFVKESSELKVKLEEAEKDAAKVKESNTKLAADINTVMKIISPIKTGDGGKVQISRDKYKADLARFGDRLNSLEANAMKPVTVDQEGNFSVTYADMVNSAITMLEKRDTQLIDQKTKVAQVEATMAQWRKDQAKALWLVKGGPDPDFPDDRSKDKPGELGDLKAEKAAVEQKLATAEMQVQKFQLQSQQLAEQKTAEVQQVRTSMQDEINKRDQEIATIKRTLETKSKEVIDLKETKTVSSYDGQVVQVNPSTRTVWVNLGLYDNLPKHLAFSVQSQGVAAGGDKPAKGKIEVVRILGDHLAEARILEDDLRDPILAGDNVYTPAWDPGQITHFAFAGKLDIDGDGTDDMDTVRGIVARAGGIIDAEVVNGAVSGPGMTIQTRYLVLGAVPADKNEAGAYELLLKQARELGIQVISMHVFFDQIGYKPPQRTMQFGTGSSGARAIEAPDGGPRVSNGQVTPLFTNRKPPTASSGSAYQN